MNIYFMSNPCMHPYCKDTKCEKCFFYKPKFLGITVPKFLGNILFKLEEVLNYGSRKKL